MNDSNDVWHDIDDAWRRAMGAVSIEDIWRRIQDEAANGPSEDAERPQCPRDPLFGPP